MGMTGRYVVKLQEKELLEVITEQEFENELTKYWREYNNNNLISMKNKKPITKEETEQIQDLLMNQNDVSLEDLDNLFGCAEDRYYPSDEELLDVSDTQND